MSMSYEERQESGTIEDRRPEAWHIDRSVSYGHILTTLTMACAIAAFMFSVNTKTETIMVRQENFERRLVQDREDIVERLNREQRRHDIDINTISVGLRRLEDKVDRLIENQADE